MNSLTLDGCVLVRTGDTWPIRSPRYRGACRGRWWPLRDHEQQDEVARALTETLDLQRLSRPPTDPMPDTVSDLEYVRSYVTACERLRIEPLYALICASLSQHSNVPAWLLALRDDCEPLGIDVIYNSGSYSFINGAYSSGRADVRAFLDAHLNSKGLFESIVRAEEFIEIYQSVIDAGANLETLDGASTVMLWEDVDLSLLRRILAGG